MTTAAIPQDYLVTDDDGCRYTRTCLVGGAVLLGIGAIAQFVPVFLLPVATALILPRWMINLHELLHVYGPEEVHPAIRCLGVSPVPLSLISLSYDEIRTLHFAHHAAPATAEDPDAYHIRGSWPRVIFNAFTAPEQSSLYWLRTHGLSTRLLIGLLLKLLLLALLAGLSGGAFLWFWLCLRLVYGLGDLAFFRLVHHQGGRYGTFSLALPASVTTLGELIVGKTVMQTTLHHSVHHRHPRIAARCLALCQD